MIWGGSWNGKWYDMTPRSSKFFAVCSLPEPPTPAPTSSPTEEASYGNIIEWLKELIADARVEIKSVKTKTGLLRLKVKTAQADVDFAERVVGQAQVVADAAAAAYAETKGEWKACKEEFEREFNRTTKEKNILNKVSSTLELLQNQKTNLNQLVEQDKADVGAFISLEDEINPVTVSQVLNLITVLVEAAEKELIKLRKDKDMCWARNDAARVENARAAGALKAARASLERAVAALQKAVAELRTQEEYEAKRIPKLVSEIDQFGLMISLLQPLFK